MGQILLTREGLKGVRVEDSEEGGKKVMGWEGGGWGTVAKHKKSGGFGVVFFLFICFLSASCTIWYDHKM